MPAVLTPAATTMVTRGDPGWDDARQEPTLASAWQAVAGSTIGDELLEWPPDLFALTEVILQRSEAYRFALSPPAGATLAAGRPSGLARCGHRCGPAVERLGRGQERAIPGLLAQEWGVLRARAGTPLSQLAEARDWRLCEALLTLHAIADEACAGLGVALDAAGADGLRVPGPWPGAAGQDGIPGSHPGTPDPGAAQGRHAPRTAVRCAPSPATPRCKCPVSRPGGTRRRPACPATQPHGKEVNYLLLPWPLRIRGSDFRPVAGPLQKLADDPFGFFEFAPAERLDLDLADRMLVAARDQAETVDVVILPESAVEHGEIDDLEALLGRHGVTGLITGVRERPPQPGQFPRNWVHIGVSVGGQWVHIRQSQAPPLVAR